VYCVFICQPHPALRSQARDQRSLSNKKLHPQNE
jgi:hypothetical protein